LDFSDTLFITQAVTPGIIILRGGDELSPSYREQVVKCILEAQEILKSPALLVINPQRARWRKLPIGESPKE
jgi:hypothetical protein